MASDWNAQYCLVPEPAAMLGPSSDYDVAVFLHHYTRAWPELQPLGKITTDILQDTGALISVLPFPAGSYRDRTMLMADIRREGIDL